MVTGHAYPWDVLGDPSFVDRSPPAVTLAAAYHSVRAATPLHPSRRIVDARHAALYRPIRDSVWTDLRPKAPDWMDEPDPFGTAAAILRAAGRRVTAWIVLTHNTRLGTLRPDVTVVNCFGERYPYALCPAHAEVRDYAATLAAEAVRDARSTGSRWRRAASSASPTSATTRRPTVRGRRGSPRCCRSAAAPPAGAPGRARRTR